MTVPFNSSSTYVEPMKDAKQAILNFSMYYYKSYKDAGFSGDDAKLRTRDMLEEVYDQFCTLGQIPPKTLGSVETKLEKLMGEIQRLAKSHPELRNVYTELMAIQKLLKR